MIIARFVGVGGGTGVWVTVVWRAAEPVLPNSRFGEEGGTSREINGTVGA